jgi:2-iminobutanoate/2-iminopropanoate deaminase
MKKIIDTNEAPKAVGPYSQAVENGGMLFISGQVGLKPAENVMIEGGVAEQTRQAMENIGAILEEAGFSFGNVVKCTCMLTDMANFKEFNEVYSTFFGEEFPARAAFGVCALPIGALVEIDCIAVK